MKEAQGFKQSGCPGRGALPRSLREPEAAIVVLPAATLWMPGSRFTWNLVVSDNRAVYDSVRLVATPG